MKRYCRNCYHPLPYKAKFCAHCGQKASDGKVPMSDLMQQLWFRVLHLESRSWRVLWRLFVPGQVSLDYFGGKRKRYPPPIQFFFVIMFFFLFTLNHFVADDDGFRMRTGGGGLQFGVSDDSTKRKIDLYQMGQQAAQAKRFRAAYDSLPPQYRTPQVHAALDSLFKRAESSKILSETFLDIEDGDTIRVDEFEDSLSFGIINRQVRVAWTDIFEYDSDQLIQKYQLTHWVDRTLLRQGIKSIKEPSTLMRSYLGSLAWTLLALVTLMAGVLTLLYWRQRRYYVEHFIFLLHEHTGLFLLLTVAILLATFTDLDSYVWSLLVLWVLVAPILAIKRYYRQGWLKTLLKSAIFSTLYLATFIFLFVSGLLVVFFIF